MKIAFLGLGKMGSGMASCLAKSGEYPMVVWNRSLDKTEPFVQLGCEVAENPADAVAKADIVMTSLLDDHSLETLFHVNSPVLKAMHPDSIHLCLTTISPECANRLHALHQAQGSRYVSAPVIGRPDVAVAGQLIQFLAGVANSQKLCLNFFAASIIEILGECFTLGEKLGVPRENLAFFFDKALPAPALNVYVKKLA